MTLLLAGLEQPLTVVAAKQKDEAAQGAAKIVEATGGVAHETAQRGPEFAWADHPSSYPPPRDQPTWICDRADIQDREGCLAEPASSASRQATT